MASTKMAPTVSCSMEASSVDMSAASGLVTAAVAAGPAE